MKATALLGSPELLEMAVTPPRVLVQLQALDVRRGQENILLKQ